MIHKSTFNIKKLFLIIIYFHLCEISNGQQNNTSTSSCAPDTDNNVDVGERLFLTPLIRTGQIDKAQELARVKNEQMEKIASSYSGFLTVNETYQSNLFFWYFPAQQNTETAPVILWLNGGPGASLMYSLFEESGPFLIKPCRELSMRNKSWHINHNLLYIDSPAGTGFSFTENEAGYAQNQIGVGNNLYEAMKQFFTLFPRLQNNDFFIAGTSYGGKYVPALGYAIHTKNPNDTPKINLKGLLIDSGLIDTINQINYGEFLYQIGQIDENGKEAFSKYEAKTTECIKKKDFECATNYFHAMVLANYSLYTNFTGFLHIHNYLGQNKEYTKLFEIFLNNTTVRRDIHVSNYTFYSKSQKVYDYLRNDMVDSVADWVVELLSHYRIMLYDGQLDGICPFPLLENAIRTWSFSGCKQYRDAKRHIWRVDSDVAGYIKQGGNLTTVLVRNAAHTVIHYQPKWALDLVKRFIANDLLSEH